MRHSWMLFTLDVCFSLWVSGLQAEFWSLSNSLSRFVPGNAQKLPPCLLKSLHSAAKGVTTASRWTRIDWVLNIIIEQSSSAIQSRDHGIWLADKYFCNGKSSITSLRSTDVSHQPQVTQASNQSPEWSKCLDLSRSAVSRCMTKQSWFHTISSE